MRGYSGSTERRSLQPLTRNSTIPRCSRYSYVTHTSTDPKVLAVLDPNASNGAGTFR